MASVDLHANMYTSMEIYDVYEMDPWYKLRCCVHWYKFLLCQTLARGVGGGGGAAYSGVGLYSKYYGTFMDQVDGDPAQVK